MALRFYSVPIDEVRDETPDTYSLFFQNPDPEAFRYEAGQYLTLRLEINGEEHRRAFSLASSPFVDDRLQLTIKRVRNGLVSNHLRDHYRKGDMLALLPPMGNFKFSPEPARRKEYVLIGAGSGITPLMSIAKTILRMEPDSHIHLWYGSRNERSIIFRDELEALRQQYAPRFHLRHTLSKPTDSWKGLIGRLTEERIFEWISDLFMVGELRKAYFICGPEAMMKAAENALLRQAVNPDDIHQEYYHAPLPSEEEIERSYATDEKGREHISDGEAEYVLEEQAIVVHLNGEKHHLLVEPGEYVLDAMIKAQLDPPYSCKNGVCTSCMAMLRKGTVVMDRDLGLSQTEMEAGYVLTCQCHPLDGEVELEFE